MPGQRRTVDEAGRTGGVVGVHPGDVEDRSEVELGMPWRGVVRDRAGESIGDDIGQALPVAADRFGVGVAAALLAPGGVARIGEMGLDLPAGDGVELDVEHPHPVPADPQTAVALPTGTVVVVGDRFGVLVAADPLPGPPGEQVGGCRFGHRDQLGVHLPGGHLLGRMHQGVGVLGGDPPRRQGGRGGRQLLEHGRRAGGGRGGRRRHPGLDPQHPGPVEPAVAEPVGVTREPAHPRRQCGLQAPSRRHPVAHGSAAQLLYSVAGKLGDDLIEHASTLYEHMFVSQPRVADSQRSGSTGNSGGGRGTFESR